MKFGARLCDAINACWVGKAIYFIGGNITGLLPYVPKWNVPEWVSGVVRGAVVLIFFVIVYYAFKKVRRVLFEKEPLNAFQQQVIEWGGSSKNVSDLRQTSEDKKNGSCLWEFSVAAGDDKSKGRLEMRKNKNTGTFQVEVVVRFDRVRSLEDFVAYRGCLRRLDIGDVIIVHGSDEESNCVEYFNTTTVQDFCENIKWIETHMSNAALMGMGPVFTSSPHVVAFWNSDSKSMRKNNKE